MISTQQCSILKKYPAAMDEPLCNSAGFCSNVEDSCLQKLLQCLEMMAQRKARQGLWNFLQKN
jgi:hypothetical protein